MLLSDVAALSPPPDPFTVMVLSSGANPLSWNPLDQLLLVAAFSTAVFLGFVWIVYKNQEKYRILFKFIWSCFVKPYSKTDSGWGGALEGFYAGQADVYDATRQGLLKGRITMMNLAAAHLRAGLKAQEKGKWVWIDACSMNIND